MLTRLTLLFTDSFQPISFSSYIFAIVSVLCGVCGGVALELLFFSVATDISKYRTHDTSHASISHINIIFPIHFLQYARIRRKRNKKEGCRKSDGGACCCDGDGDSGNYSKIGAQVSVTVDCAIYDVVDAIVVLHLIGIQLWPIHVRFYFKSEHNNVHNRSDFSFSPSHSYYSLYYISLLLSKFGSINLFTTMLLTDTLIENNGKNHCRYLQIIFSLKWNI